MNFGYIKYLSAAMVFLGNVSATMADKAITVQEIVQLVKNTMTSLNISDHTILHGQNVDFLDFLNELSDRMDEIFEDRQVTAMELIELIETICNDLEISGKKLIEV
jgi:DNA-binding LytR/AlgR family response regulator